MPVNSGTAYPADKEPTPMPMERFILVNLEMVIAMDKEPTPTLMEVSQVEPGGGTN